MCLHMCAPPDHRQPEAHITGSPDQVIVVCSVWNLRHVCNVWNWMVLLNADQMSASVPNGLIGTLRTWRCMINKQGMTVKGTSTFLCA